MSGAIEISVGDVNDVEARVFARYTGDDAANVEVRGTVRGPFCEGSRTLPAVIVFRPAGAPGLAEAVVPDPCTWTPELPHVYQIEVEARIGERMISRYDDKIGLRRAAGIRGEPRIDADRRG